MKVDIKDKIALVTGAGGHIGSAISEILAANGAKVIYADNNIDAAKEAASKTPNSVGVAMDVTDEQQVKQVIEKTAKDYGSLDILVNNAGVNLGSERCTIDQFKKEHWDWILGVDLTGLFLVSKYGSQQMIKQKSGRIINISSIAGLVPLRLQSAYDAAKAGVVNLTKAMAIELGEHGILVNCIAPGSIVTSGTKKLFYGEDGTPTEWGTDLLSHIPLGRPGECSEIGYSVLFLAAPESSYLTGQAIAVDGGWTAGYIRNF